MPDDQPTTAASKSVLRRLAVQVGSPTCCCLGLVGNTNYMCMARGLDLDPPHCGDECDQRPDCVDQHIRSANGD